MYKSVELGLISSSKWSHRLHTGDREESARSMSSQKRGYEDRRGGEEVNPEICFYGGAFPLSLYSKE